MEMTLADLGHLMELARKYNVKTVYSHGVRIELYDNRGLTSVTQSPGPDVEQVGEEFGRPTEEEMLFYSVQPPSIKSEPPA